MPGRHSKGRSDWRENGRATSHGLKFLLAFNGRIHHLAQGYWLKIEITRRETTPERPHRLSYSFTLHAPDGTRLVGFDNAHNVPAWGSRFKRRGQAIDYWYRTEKDRGRPYEFKDVETSIATDSASPDVCGHRSALRGTLRSTPRSATVLDDVHDLAG